MIPNWFNFDEIPFNEMCYGDRLWLPLLLEGKKFNAYFLYDKNGYLLEKTINLCDEI